MAVMSFLREIAKWPYSSSGRIDTVVESAASHKVAILSKI